MELHEKIDKIFRDAELLRAFFQELEGIDPGPLYGLQTDGGDVFSVLAAGSPGNAYLIASLSPPHQMPDPIDIYEQVREIALEEAGGDEEKRALLHMAFICERADGWPSIACNTLPILRDRGYLLSTNFGFPSAPIPILDFLAALRGGEEPVSDLGRMAAQKLEE